MSASETEIEGTEPEVEPEPTLPDGYLLGESEVSLTINVAGALTPEVAVDHIINALIRQGAGSFFFDVTDKETGAKYTVLNGRTLTEDDLEALRAQETGDGTEGS